MGGGIGDYLKNLWGALSGGGGTTPQQQSGTTSAATSAPAAATSDAAAPEGLPPVSTSFFDNPYLQGALATYLGAIGSPRREGLGGAIAKGGLAGLGAYNAAQKAQYEPYIQGAKIAHEQAQTKQALATAAHEEETTKGLRGIPAHNASIGAQLLAAKSTMSPESAQRADMIANAISTDTTKAWDMETVLKAVYGEPTEELRNRMTAVHEQSATDIAQAKLPGELQKQQADIQRDYAETQHQLADASLTPDKRQVLQDRAKQLEQQIQYGGVKPKMMTMYGPPDPKTGIPAQQMVTVAPGYEPPSGWSLIRPLQKPPTPQGAINQKKIADAYTAIHGGSVMSLLSGAPTLDQFFQQQGYDMNSGLPLKGSGAAATYTAPTGIGDTAPPTGAPTAPGPQTRATPRTGAAKAGAAIPQQQIAKYQAKGYIVDPTGTQVYVPGKGWGRYDPNTPDEE
jgi:hypothetical protein